MEILIPSLIASIVAYALFSSWAGWEPIFGLQGNLVLEHPIQLAYYGVLRLLCGVFGVLYARTFYRV